VVLFQCALEAAIRKIVIVITIPVSLISINWVAARNHHPALLAYPTWHVACVKVNDIDHRERAPCSDLRVKGRCRMYGNALVHVDCGCISW
jgi:hypothetical protein